MIEAKVVNLLQEKLIAQDASDERSDINEGEYSNELFDFYIKQAITLAERMLQKF